MAIVKRRTVGGGFLGFWHEEEKRWATQAEYEATYDKKEGPGDEEDDDDVDYEELTKSQLGQRLTKKGVEFSPHLTEQQMIELCRAGKPATSKAE